MFVVRRIFTTFIIPRGKLAVLSAMRAILGMSVLFAGCAAVNVSPYPTDWPPVSQSQPCGQWKRSYVNRTLLTTLWKSPKNPDVGSAYLSRLLSDGTTGSDARDGTVFYVSLNASSLVATLHGAGDQVISTLELRRNWSCSHDSGIVGVFSADAPGEGSIGLQAHSTLTISLANDGSIVVHDRTEFRGGIPGGGSSETWMRFLEWSR